MFAQRHLSLKIQCRVTTRTSLGLCHFYSSLPIPANNVAEKAQQRKRKKEKTEEDRKREREYARQYRLAHKEATLQREKLYRSQNRELLRERQRQHYIKKQDTTRNYLPRKKYVVLLFTVIHVSKSWKNQEKVREFLESVKEQLHITDRCDWYRISRVQICEVGGMFTVGFFSTFFSLPHDERKGASYHIWKSWRSSCICLSQRRVGWTKIFFPREKIGPALAARDVEKNSIQRLHWRTRNCRKFLTSRPSLGSVVWRLLPPNAK